MSPCPFFPLSTYLLLFSPQLTCHDAHASHEIRVPLLPILSPCHKEKPQSNDLSALQNLISPYSLSATTDKDKSISLHLCFDNLLPSTSVASCCLGTFGEALNNQKQPGGDGAMLVQWLGWTEDKDAVLLVQELHKEPHVCRALCYPVQGEQEKGKTAGEKPAPCDFGSCTSSTLTAAFWHIKAAEICFRNAVSLHLPKRV